MLVPPSYDSQEKKEHDVNILRMFYIYCEHLEISEKDDIQKSFFHLVHWAGKENFMEEFLIFEKYVKNYHKK